MESVKMESLMEDEEENKLEITRNPFDSQLYEKDNFPHLDASIFTDVTTPKRKSDEGGFRWSIDQIAKMKPADMELFPNQEYSVIYEKKEDEEKVQKEVDEYFKHVLLPSPWLYNNAENMKRVTFSPHPQITRYEKDTSGASFSSTEADTQNVSKCIPDSTEETLLSDACCQTMLTFPVNFDLQSLIGKNFYSYSHDSKDATDLMVSSLRRKLFGQESRTPTKENPVDKSPKGTPNYTTSSPTKETVKGYCRQVATVSSQKSNSDDVSPPSLLRSGSNESAMSVFSPMDGFSPKQASNVGTPMHPNNKELSFSSVDVSPIQSSGNNDEQDNNYSFLPDVSFELNDSESDIRESSRNVRFDSPDISPIKNEFNNISLSVTTSNNTDSLDIQELDQQSIKESTARNIHAFSGLDISSINENSSKFSNQQLSKLSRHEEGEEDQGPLDINDLTSVEEDTSSENQDKTDEAEGDPLNITDLVVTKSQGSLEQSSLNNQVNNDAVKSDIPFVSPIFSQLTPDSCSTTPLKGILKLRGTVTPTRSNLKGLNREESTRFNTVCNSGQRDVLPEPTFTQILPTFVKNNQLPRPVLVDKVEQEFKEIFDDDDDESPVLEFDSKLNFNKDMPLNEDIVCVRANSALKRARRCTSSLEKELTDKENNPVRLFRRRSIQLNSTELVGNSTETTSQCFTPSDVFSAGDDKLFLHALQRDSGVSSMDWSNANTNSDKSKLKKSPQGSSISPLLRLGQLSLSNRKSYQASPWSSKKFHDKSSFLNRSTNQATRLLLYRSYSWPHRERIRSLTPSNSCAPKSRVTPKYRSRHYTPSYKVAKVKDSEGFESISSAYKDLLPSPLK